MTKFRNRMLWSLPIVLLAWTLPPAPAQAQFVQQGHKLVSTSAVGFAGQGTSVSLSGDRNTAIVGGPFDNGSAGAAFVYTRSGGRRTQQGAKLVGTGAVGPSSAGQGGYVSLSGDGNLPLHAAGLYLMTVKNVM